MASSVRSVPQTVRSFEGSIDAALPGVGRMPVRSGSNLSASNNFLQGIGMSYDEADGYDAWKPVPTSPPQVRSPQQNGGKPWRPNPGSRVRRNPTHWVWGDQDGGGEGTVIDVDPNAGWVTVKWDVTATTEKYRYGAEDAFDIEPIAPPVDVTGELVLPVGPLTLDNRSRQELKDSCRRDIAQTFGFLAADVTVASLQTLDRTLFVQYRIKCASNEKAYMSQAKGRALLEARSFYLEAIRRTISGNIKGTPPKVYPQWNKCWVDIGVAEEEMPLAVRSGHLLPASPPQEEGIEVEVSVGNRIITVFMSGVPEYLLVGNIRESVKQKMPDVPISGFVLQKDGQTLSDGLTLHAAQITPHSRLYLVPLPSPVYPHRASTPPPKSPSPYERLQARATPPSAASSHSAQSSPITPYYPLASVAESRDTQVKMKSLFGY